MEKLQYLCWPRAGVTPADAGRIARDELAPALLALGPRGLSLQVDDTDAQVPVPMPPPADEPQPFLLVSIWLDRYDDRAPYETPAARRERPHRGLPRHRVDLHRVRRQPIRGAAHVARR